MISHRTRRCGLVHLFIAGLLISATAHAASHTWTGTTSNAWSVSTNWTGGAPAAAENPCTLIFPSGTLNQDMNNDVANLTNVVISFGAGGYSVTGQAISLSGGITNDGINSIGVDITLSVAQTFTINSGQLTISSVMSAAVGVGYTKDGAGTLLLSGTSTYNGLTGVSAGTLTVTGSIGSSKVNLTGGTLNGIGTIGGVTADGIVSPGTSGPAILSSTGNAAFNSGSTFTVQLNGTSAGSGYDQLNVTGTVTPGGTLNATLGFASANADAFTIINNDGAEAIVGEFDGLPEGSTLTLGTESFTVTYKGGTGNDVVLTHVVTISGTVVDKNNNPAVGITVSDGTRSATTANDGTYVIMGVPNGSHTVAASLTGRLFDPPGTDVTISNGSVSGIDFKLLGTPSDIDGDGFSDAVETAAGTSPSDTASTPFSGQLAPAAEALTLTKLQIKLNLSIFIKLPTDSLSFAGTLPVSAGFSPTGQQVICDVGGVIRVFNLTDKGISPKGNDSFKISKPKDGVAKYAVKFSKGSFVSSYVDELLRATIDAKNEARQVVVTVYFTNRIFSKTCDLIWNAKMFKTGSAKLTPVR